MIDFKGMGAVIAQATSNAGARATPSSPLEFRKPPIEKVHSNRSLDVGSDQATLRRRADTNKVKSGRSKDSFSQVRTNVGNKISEKAGSRTFEAAGNSKARLIKEDSSERDDGSASSDAAEKMLNQIENSQSSLSDNPPAETDAHASQRADTTNTSDNMSQEELNWEDVEAFSGDKTRDKTLELEMAFEKILESENENEPDSEKIVSRFSAASSENVDLSAGLPVDENQFSENTRSDTEINEMDGMITSGKLKELVPPEAETENQSEIADVSESSSQKDVDEKLDILTENISQPTTVESKKIDRTEDIKSDQNTPVSQSIVNPEPGATVADLGLVLAQGSVTSVFIENVQAQKDNASENTTIQLGSTIEQGQFGASRIRYGANRTAGDSQYGSADSSINFANSAVAQFSQISEMKPINSEGSNNPLGIIEAPSSGGERNSMSILAGGTNNSPSGNATVSQAGSVTSALATPVTHREWGDAFNQHVQMMANSQIQKAEIQVNPPHLGPVRVQIDVKGEDINIVISTQHGAVRDAVESGLPKLRELLADNGTRTVNIDVSLQNYQHRQGSPYNGDTGYERPAQGRFMQDASEVLEPTRATTIIPAVQLSLLDLYA